jgi:light-regulated signal transduction histidine kinase (bacteriophytochrome)
MQRMVQSLLGYCRIGKGPEQEVEVDMAAALRHALANLAVRIDEAQAVVEAGPLPAVRGRLEELVRLWQNLVANAITFRSAEAPRIRITAVASAGGWTFSVADNGIGIAAEEAGRLFGLFQRLHPTDRYPGTGIGLASCRKIVEHHGGRIWFESVPGHGTTFLFTLGR